MTSREEFIEVANSLGDVYPGFSKCLYAEAYKQGLIDKIFTYMKQNSSCSTDEVLHYLDNLLGNPRPVIHILKESDRQPVAV